MTIPETVGPSLYAQAGRTLSGSIILRLINASPAKQEVNIDLKGAGEARYRATASHLVSKDLDAENTLAEPARIIPVAQPEEVVGSRFRWELEGNSITVSRLVQEAG